MSGLRYLPDPTTWPVRIAQYQAIARDLLQEGTVLRTGDFIMRLLAEERIEGDPQQAWSSLGDQQLRVPELEHLGLEALNRMVADGEAFGFDRQAVGQHYFDMAAALGWDSNRTQEPTGPISVRPTVRLSQLRAAAWQPFETWDGVRRLVEESRTAYVSGLYVASAATARVAAEQAVLEGLKELDAETEGRANARETRLFEALNPGLFAGQLLDHTATRTTLSSVRSLGNDAAHDGVVQDLSLHEALARLLPQALTSLAKAIENSDG